MVLSLILHNIHATLARLMTWSSDEKSLFEELWEYFEGKYFSVDLGKYEHISVGSGSLITLRNIILGICIGIVIASAMMSYEKNKKGAFVRAVIRNQCLWPDKAMTLAELGFDKSFAVKSDLRRTTALSKVVKCVERQAHDSDVASMRQAYIEKNGNDNGFVEPAFQMDFANAHFYIPDEEHYAADIRYDNKGFGWRSFLLVLVVSVVLAALVCFLLPEMLQLVDNMIGILKPDDGYMWITNFIIR